MDATITFHSYTKDRVSLVVGNGPTKTNLAGSLSSYEITPDSRGLRHVIVLTDLPDGIRIRQKLGSKLKSSYGARDIDISYGARGQVNPAEDK